MKRLLIGTFLLLTGGVATAQTGDVPPGEGGAGVRAGHITATGETVPNPGASQGAGTTSLDRGVQAEDNKIDTSICKGC
jgi:hypothetical protein